MILAKDVSTLEARVVVVVLVGWGKVYPTHTPMTDDGRTTTTTDDG